MTRTPSLAEVINFALDQRLGDVRISMPGRVERWDPNKQLIDAQPLVKQHYEDEEGNTQTEALPLIPNVPVVYPSGGGFSLKFPLRRGDSVLLVFSASSLDRWLDGGGLVDPVDDYRHALADAVAIPGLHDFRHPLATPHVTALTVGRDGDPDEPAVCGDELHSFLTALLNTVRSLTGQASYTVTPPTSVPAGVRSGTVRVTR